MDIYRQIKSSLHVMEVGIKSHKKIKVGAIKLNLKIRILKLHKNKNENNVTKSIFEPKIYAPAKQHKTEQHLHNRNVL